MKHASAMTGGTGTAGMMLLRRSAAALALLAFVAGGLVPPEVVAQRPFRVHDPFYLSETARRTFFDGYALGTQVSYHSEGTYPREGAADPDPIGFSFRADYELAPRFDLSAIFDASGSAAGRRISMSWLALKYYRNVETADYAVRLAVDPAVGGRVGFPQVDAAFIYTSPVTPMITSDVAFGVRRVRMGFEQLVPAAPGGTGSSHQITYTRADGWELHGMVNYSMLFDPAGSNVFAALSAEIVNYQLVDLALDAVYPALQQGLPTNVSADVAITPVEVGGEADHADVEEAPREHVSGVFWARAGVALNRPSYQVLPFASLPLAQWMPEEGQWHQARFHFGLRFTLR